MAENRVSAFSLQHIGERDQVAYHMEPGWQFALRKDGNRIWMYGSFEEGEAESWMAKIEAIAHRPGTLEAFTLFMHEGKGWQMSTRRTGEPGWSIEIIPEEQAARLLGMLEPIGHPDGPFRVIEPKAATPIAGAPADASAALVKAMAEAAAARAELTEALKSLAP